MLNLCVIAFGPLRSGGNGYFIRSWNVVKEASRHYDSVVVLEFPDEYVDFKHRVGNIEFITLHGNENVSNRLTSVLKRVITYDPFHDLRFQLLSFIELWKCRTLISEMSVTLVEGALIPAGVVFAKLWGKKVILDTHGMNRLLATRFRDRQKMVYLLRFFFWDVLERFALRLSDLVIVVSEKEKKVAVDSYGIQESKVFVVPNVLDTTKSIPSYDATQSLRKRLGLENKIVATYIGDLRVVHNADAVDFIVRRLAPAFWKTRKDVGFLIIGRTDKRPRNNPPNVVFTGFVKDLSSYIEMSDICIAPLRVGCGVKTKVIEYLIHGKPIVTTFSGIEGLEPFIPNQSKDFIRVVPPDLFHEALLQTVSNLHTMNASKVEISPELLLSNFRKTLKEVLYHTQ